MLTVNGREVQQPGYDNPKTMGKKTPVIINGPGLTLEQLSGVTGLPLEFYRGLGLRDVTREHVSTTYIPYLDQHGEYITARYLTRLSGNANGVRSRILKAIPYGWWQISEI